MFNTVSHADMGQQRMAQPGTVGGDGMARSLCA